jgi:ligand-binding sensor domain-containing protein
MAQKFTFLNYSTKEGLAQSQVNDIAQDKENYLWIATLDGLSKFNGKTFQNYYQKDGLLSNRISSITIDAEDNVWAVTSSGISILTADSIFPFGYNNLFLNEEIIAVSHQNSKVIVSTESGGIFVFDQKQDEIELTRIHKKPLENVKIRDVFLEDYKLLISTSHGLFQLWNDEITQVSLPWNYDFTGVGVTQKGEIWLASSENGVCYYEKNNQFEINQKNSALLNNFSTSLMVDNQGTAWVTSNSALSEITKDKAVENYSVENGFESIAQVVFQDNEGNIWIGTNGKGLMKFANKEFKFLTKQKDLPSDLVISICEDNQGSIWLGSLGEGVSRIKENRIESFNARKTNFPNNNCWVIHKDLMNNMWFGTSQGLALLSGKTFKTFTEKDGLPANKIQSIFQEVPGVMWIGTKDGVAYYKENKFYTLEEYPYRNTRSISSTQDGIYWFGTSDGLVRYDGFETLLLEDSLLLGNTIYAIESFGNKLWIGSDKGLVYFDGKHFERIEIVPGLKMAAINFLKIDKESRLWIGTNNGIYSLNASSFLRGEKELASYTINNGLIGMETNLNAVFQDSKGNIWMGTSEGINVYKEFKTKHNVKTIPSVHLTSVKLLFGEKEWLSTFRNSKNLSFGYKKNTFTFYYHSNYFKDPERIKYSYYLEGFDDSWSPMESANFSRYPSLPHGSYTFKVKSTLDGITWSNIDEVSFTITAPFWLTWWFRITTLLLFVLIVYFFLRRRRQALRKEREVELLNYKNKLIKLEQQSLNASMNRHFIFNSLNSIQFYINKEDKLSANRYLSNFSKLIRKNLDSSSAEDNLIPLSEEIERLTLYLSLENMRFKEKFTYHIHIDEQVETELTKVPAMFMQPFIENSIWHGVLPMEEPGEITIHIFKKGTKTIFEITDNGIGISTSLKNKSLEQNEHSSKGMKIAANRIELLQKIIEREITITGPFDILEEGKVMGTKVVIVFG